MSGNRISIYVAGLLRLVLDSDRPQTRGILTTLAVLFHISAVRTVSSEVTDALFPVV